MASSSRKEVSSSRRAARRIIHEAEYGDDVELDGGGPDDIISDDNAQEVLPQYEGGGPAEVGAPSTNAPSTKATSKRKQSSVWDHFDRIVDEVTKKTKAQCKYCHCSLAIVQGSTSSLTRHAKKCAPKKGSNDPKQTRLSTTGSNIGIASTSHPQLDPEVMKSKLMKMIVCTKQPFCFSENPWFTEWNQYLNPEYVPVPRNTGRGVVIKDYDDFRGAILNLFQTHKGFFSFTADMWTSKQRLGYIGICAHFIDSNWILQKRLIAFKMLEHPHSGVNMANIFLDVVRGLNIHDRLFSITLDNASNNDKMVETIARRTRLQFPSIFHVRCSTHIINLFVQEGLKISDEYIGRVRGILLHISASGPKIQSYKQVCKEQGIRPKKFDIDTKHRWNSTYLMLKSIDGYEDPLISWCDLYLTDSSLNVDRYDFHVARIMMDFLEVFYDATKELSGTYYCTSHLFVHNIFKITTQFAKYRSHEVLDVFIFSMEEKFKEYWKSIPLLPLLALAMDPRLKLKGVLFSMKHFYLNMCIDENKDDVIKEKDVRDGLEKMYKSYDQRYSHYRNLGRSPSSGASSSNAQPLFSMWDQEEETVTGTNDLERYTYDRVFFRPEERANLNVLEWWKANSTTFPVLSIMAKDLLTPPMSTVAVESTFSTSGRVIKKDRSRLAPDAVEAAMCLDDWYHQEERLAQLNHLDDIAEDFTYFSITGDDSN